MSKLGKLYLLPVPISEVGTNNFIPEHNLVIVKGLTHFIAEDAKTARRFLPQSLLGKAIDHALNQWPSLHVFLEDGGEEIGAVRIIRPESLVIYVEGAGDFLVKADALRAVHYGKVVLDVTKLDPQLLSAAEVAHVHETD